MDFFSSFSLFILLQGGASCIHSRPTNPYSTLLTLSRANLLLLGGFCLRCARDVASDNPKHFVGIDTHRFSRRRLCDKNTLTLLRNYPAHTHTLSADGRFNRPRAHVASRRSDSGYYLFLLQLFSSFPAASDERIAFSSLFFLLFLTCFLWLVFFDLFTVTTPVFSLLLCFSSLFLVTTISSFVKFDCYYLLLFSFFPHFIQLLVPNYTTKSIVLIHARFLQTSISFFEQ